jgi:hypothetical protein
VAHEPRGFSRQTVSGSESGSVLSQSLGTGDESADRHLAPHRQVVRWGRRRLGEAGGELRGGLGARLQALEALHELLQLRRVLHPPIAVERLPLGVKGLLLAVLGNLRLQTGEDGGQRR